MPLVVFNVSVTICSPFMSFVKAKAEFGVNVTPVGVLQFRESFVAPPVGVPFPSIVKVIVYVTEPNVPYVNAPVCADEIAILFTEYIFA